MTETIRNTINRFASGYVFTTLDFPVDVSKQATANRILNNMVAAKQIFADYQRSVLLTEKRKRIGKSVY